MTPQFRKGDIWSVLNEADALFILTNNVITQRNGVRRLVMGAGIAKQAKECFPGLPEDCARRIMQSDKTIPYARIKNDPAKLFYGILATSYPPLMLFQTKYDWGWDSDLDLISGSISSLLDYCEYWEEQYPGATPRFHLPYPGIGKGNLTEEQVYPLLEPLPEYITVWTYGEEDE